jgi:hypothetical protein
MAHPPSFNRPTFVEALTAWETVLSQHRHPIDLLWIFDENLCFEKDPAGPTGFRLGFQTRFSPPPPDAEQIAFEYFSEFDARIVFYRLGNFQGKSVTLLLCDDWFESKGEPEGFMRRDDWLISFRAGGPEEIEEITDEARYQRRILRDRPLHDLDFCMTLRAVHETLAHGRVLTAYEHYALKFLDAWRRMLRGTE